MTNSPAGSAGMGGCSCFRVRGPLGRVAFFLIAGEFDRLRALAHRTALVRDDKFVEKASVSKSAPYWRKSTRQRLLPRAIFAAGGKQETSDVHEWSCSRRAPR